MESKVKDVVKAQIETLKSALEELHAAADEADANNVYKQNAIAQQIADATYQLNSLKKLLKTLDGSK